MLLLPKREFKNGVHNSILLTQIEYNNIELK